MLIDLDFFGAWVNKYAIIFPLNFISLRLLKHINVVLKIQLKLKLVLTHKPVVPKRVGMRLNIDPHKVGELDKDAGISQKRLDHLPYMVGKDQ